MNRFCLLILICLQLQVCTVKADSQKLSEMINDLLTQENYSEEIISKYKAFPIDSLADDSFSVAYHEVSLLLGWYTKDKELFLQSIKHLEAYQQSDYLQFKSKEAFVDTCDSCEGSGIGKVSCFSCKGNGKCTNYLCNEGKIKVKNKDFGEILVDCSICLGKDTCKKCGGEGTVPANCPTCMRKGIAFSMKKVRTVLNDKLLVLKALVEKKAEVDFITSQKAKGLVKVGDRWLTQSQIQQLSAAKNNGQAPYNPESLLESLEKLYANDAEGTVLKVKQLRQQFPESELNLQIDNKLEYIRLLSESESLEKAGEINRLVRVLKEALSLQDSKELRQKIQYFDEQTLGL